MKAHTPKLRTTTEGREKLCTKCDEWWPADVEFFYADPNGSAGLFYCCKACYLEHFRPPASRRVVVNAPAPVPLTAELATIRFAA